MPSNKPKRQATWSDVKTGLADFDRARLMDMVRDLYVASKDTGQWDIELPNPQRAH